MNYKKGLVVAFLLVGCALAPVAGVAQNVGLWTADSLYSNIGAGARTISLNPKFPRGDNAAQSWAIAIDDSSDTDTLTCICEYYSHSIIHPASTNARRFTLTTRMAPGFPGRVDSLQLRFPAGGHERVRVYLALANGSSAPPTWGLGLTTVTGTVPVRETSVGDLTLSVVAVAAGGVVDSIAGATANYHVPIGAFTIAVDETVWVNTLDASGDSSAVCVQVNPDVETYFAPVDLYQILFSKHTANATVQVRKYAGGAERVAP